ncbi:MAG TPA: hypothetical protein VN694_02680 [Caulobacteraceae bacterium]|nr:hypothetical protein [Caulobacteraceae bacterium]
MIAKFIVSPLALASATTPSFPAGSKNRLEAMPIVPPLCPVSPKPLSQPIACSTPCAAWGRRRVSMSAIAPASDVSASDVDARPIAAAARVIMSSIVDQAPPAGAIDEMLSLGAGAPSAACGSAARASCAGVRANVVSVMPSGASTRPASSVS